MDATKIMLVLVIVFLVLTVVMAILYSRTRALLVIVRRQREHFEHSNKHVELRDALRTINEQQRKLDQYRELFGPPLDEKCPPFEEARRRVGIVLYTEDGTAYRPHDITKAVMTLHRLRKMAAASGWTPDDAEGVIEYVTRKHYEQGRDDARTTPLRTEAVRLVERWKVRAGNVAGLTDASTEVRLCAMELNMLVMPKET